MHFVIASIVALLLVNAAAAKSSKWPKGGWPYISPSGRIEFHENSMNSAQPYNGTKTVVHLLHFFNRVKEQVTSWGFLSAADFMVEYVNKREDILKDYHLVFVNRKSTVSFFVLFAPFVISIIIARTRFRSGGGVGCSGAARPFG